MATLESIAYSPHRAVLTGDKVEWRPVKHGKEITALPQVFWNNCTPWREANLWALERATSKDVDIKTVQSGLTALHAYANWIETTAAEWWSFPLRKADRCLVRYRKTLIDARDRGDLAPSTATQRMAAVIQFYRWLYGSGLISPQWPMWTERVIGIRLVDPVGLHRTIAVTTTDLSIRNRKAHGEGLEDGLLPVSTKDRDAILEFAQANASKELFLMLSIGFFTGMRLGTLADLKIQSLERAAPDPATPELYRLAVGPGSCPPVHTKGGVTGHVYITRAHLDALREYAFSPRRLKRQMQAAPEDRHHLFLTRFGNRYAGRGSNKSPAINVELHALRNSTAAKNLKALREFHFHQTRCTFGTELARLAIAHAGTINALQIVKEFLLHKREASTLRYIKFVEKTPAKEAAANAFTRDFLGLIAERSQRE